MRKSKKCDTNGSLGNLMIRFIYILFQITNSNYIIYRLIKKKKYDNNDSIKAATIQFP